MTGTHVETNKSLVILKECSKIIQDSSKSVNTSIHFESAVRAIKHKVNHNSRRLKAEA